MGVAALIGIMIAIVVAVGIIPSLLEVGSEIVEVLPLIFVVVTILGTVAWLGFSGEETEKRDSTLVPQSIKDWFRKYRKWVFLALGLLMIWSLVSLLGWNN